MALEVRGQDRVPGTRLRRPGLDRRCFFFALVEREIDGGKQVLGRERLVDESGRMGGAGAIEQLPIGIGGYVDDRDVVFRPDPVGGFDAVHAFAEPDVHEDEIGPQFAGFLDGLVAVRRNRHDVVTEAAQAHPELRPIKVNVVALRDFTEDEVLRFAEFARQNPYEVRFIEFMPLDADRAWNNGSVFSQREILGVIEQRHGLEPVDRTSAPASRWRYRDGRGSVGVVASVTQSFCDSCDRVRMTADGQFRNCLFATTETDLRSLLRSGAEDDEIAAALERSVAAKWAGHGINQVHFIRPRRSMSQIGG